jgi:glycosyltransferase involved in cell wall biosynthesis
MKTAIASSGLGHVNRGIETWALDTANALYRKQADVTLFAAGRVDSEAKLEIIPCIRRRTFASRLITRSLPPFSWRWGLKSGYGLEQLTFWQKLKPRLKTGKYDILHVQDPLLADLCRKARLKGEITTREILAHGTEEPPEFLARFEYLQHLAPWHLEHTKAALQDAGNESDFFNWIAMPNFIDTERYHPIAGPAEKAELRRRLDIPEKAFVIITAAAIKKDHKRIDYLIREFAEFANAAAAGLKPFLLIAGSCQDDTAELQKFAHELSPATIRFFINHPHDKVADLLQASDMFVLTSLFEMMPIALLEAIACGLPPITNSHPILKWMSGPAGIHPDLSSKHALVKALASLRVDIISKQSRQARQHALNNFSETRVITQYINYYKQVAG